MGGNDDREQKREGLNEILTKRKFEKANILLYKKYRSKILTIFLYYILLPTFSVFYLNLLSFTHSHEIILDFPIFVILILPSNSYSHFINSRCLEGYI